MHVVTHRLISLGAALVARVRRHLHHRLHLRGTRHNAFDAHQLADALCLDVTYCQVLDVITLLEVYLAVSTKYIQSPVSCFNVITICQQSESDEEFINVKTHNRRMSSGG